MLSSNVLLDVPDDVRRQRVDALLEQAGPIRPGQTPLAERVITAAHPAELRWRINCAHGALICDIRLTALAEPVVRTVDEALADPTGRKPRDEAPSAVDHVHVVLSMWNNELVAVIAVAGTLRSWLLALW